MILYHGHKKHVQILFLFCFVFLYKFFFLLQRKICYGEQEIMQMQDYMRKLRTILPLPVTDFSLYIHKLPTSLLQNARMFMGIRDFPIDILTRSVRNTMTFQWLSFLPWGNSFFFFFLKFVQCMIYSWKSYCRDFCCKECCAFWLIRSASDARTAIASSCWQFMNKQFSTCCSTTKENLSWLHYGIHYGTCIIHQLLCLPWYLVR